MLNKMTSNSPARGLHGAPILLLVGLLVGCNVGPGASPTPTGSPTTPPTPSPTPSPTPGPTAGEIDHPLGAHEVILRMESGGGFVPMEFLLTQAPQFTLYGDGTVIYQQTSDAIGGQGLPPFLVGHMDEEAVQALLRFALGEGRLLGARADYPNNMVADAGTTVFTINAGGESKTVSVYALGMEDPNMPADIADRRGFMALAEQLGTFEARGRSGELGDVVEYDPSHYRVFLIDAGDVHVQTSEWPWEDLTPANFTPEAQDSFRRVASLDKAHVEVLEETPTGGRAGIYVEAEGKIWSIGIRPLFPDELAAEDLG
jgi:hypothetical protein